MTDGLQKLFGSPARVKLLRLFLFNPRLSFTLAEAGTRARVTDEDVRREVRLFASIGLVSVSKRGSKQPGRGIRYVLNAEFEYVAALQNLLLNAPERGEDIVGRIRHAGTLKFVVLAGMFLGEWEGTLDLLIVGDRMKERKLRDEVRKLEAEIGKEIRYASLTTTDFFYRLNLNDKLIRDVLDYPHQIVLDRLDIGLK
ncbi:MAG TPA: hypothetical protein VG984_00140 [Candidatus Paceibacterota bacterium]|nr:hypothetical protein [Candidatus Paceibacterota bacterium]